MVHELTRQEARRIAVRAQRLDAERPADLLELVRHLTLLQADLTAAVAPSATLVCWSRLGNGFTADELAERVAEGALVELRGMLRPAEDVALYRAEMQAWPGEGEQQGWQAEIGRWVAANGECRRDVLELLRAEGPLPARAIPDTCALPWRSSGWTNNKNVVRLLDFMEARGEVAVAPREGRERLWDLAERIYPDTAVVPLEEARRERDRRRLVALGIARSRAPESPSEPDDVGEAGEPAVVEGVKGTWRVDPDQLGRPFRGRTALLSPLDRLLFDRRRMGELFEFDYTLEMYKPAGKRRWGYWAMPVLHGDRLVGKLDATADRAAGVLRVDALHEDEPFSRPRRTAVEREVRALARWLDLEPVWS